MPIARGSRHKFLDITHGTNDAPVANAAALFSPASRRHSLSFSAGLLLAGVSDTDGDTLSVVNLSSLTPYKSSPAMPPQARHHSKAATAPSLDYSISDGIQLMTSPSASSSPLDNDTGLWLRLHHHQTSNVLISSAPVDVISQTAAVMSSTAPSLVSKDTLRRHIR